MDTYKYTVNANTTRTRRPLKLYLSFLFKGEARALRLTPGDGHEHGRERHELLRLHGFPAGHLHRRLRRGPGDDGKGALRPTASEPGAGVKHILESTMYMISSH